MKRKMFIVSVGNFNGQYINYRMYSGAETGRTMLRRKEIKIRKQQLL